jgi:hypothetical protein
MTLNYAAQRDACESGIPLGFVTHSNKKKSAGRTRLVQMLVAKLPHSLSPKGQHRVVA